jgi:fatty acid desaturase
MSVMAGPIDGVKLRAAAIEWPSVVLCSALYTSFAVLTFFHGLLATPITVTLGAFLLAWHSSMQHEFIHGHPTRWRRLNRALATPPLALWLPFESYRRSHLVHHQDEHLTDPLDDPESYYWTAGSWAALGPLGRAVVRFHTTLLGRLLIGPAWNIGRYWRSEFRAVRGGDRQRRGIWLRHAVAVAAMLVWVVGICHMNLLIYAAMAYAGTSILLLRSFAEHRANQNVFERTAIVENAWVLGPLYLFNNLHAAHHDRPLLPWYQLPAWYRANRQRLLAENGGLVYSGYADVVRRFLLEPHDVVIHPQDDLPHRT